MISNIINLNITGWMADFGEYSAVDMFSRSAPGMTQEEVHNQFPVVWAQTNK